MGIKIMVDKNDGNVKLRDKSLIEQKKMGEKIGWKRKKLSQSRDRVIKGRRDKKNDGRWAQAGIIFCISILVLILHFAFNTLYCMGFAPVLFSHFHLSLPVSTVKIRWVFSSFLFLTIKPSWATQTMQ